MSRRAPRRSLTRSASCRTATLSLIASAAAAAASRPSSATLTASYETTVDAHASTLLSLFLADELNKEWSSRLTVQRTISTREYGEVAYQQYAMPWPLSPRELLMKCERQLDHRNTRLVSACYSVDHPSVPKSADAVRIELRHTEWQITALPDGRTRIQLALEIPASAAHAVPGFVVRYCQRSMLRDSVSEFLNAVGRLRLPAHASSIGWHRSRTETATARAEARAARRQAGWDSGSLWFLLLACAAVFGLVQGALQGGVLGVLFACCRVLAIRLSLLSVTSIAARRTPKPTLTPTSTPAPTFTPTPTSTPTSTSMPTSTPTSTSTSTPEPAPSS